MSQLTPVIQPDRHPDTIRIGLVSVSDRASKGVYQDQGIPALQSWLAKRSRHQSNV